MSWNLDSSRPIYTQIVERISLDIIAGKYQPGARLPSVRDFASEAGVNPNTMQKALAELEREDLVHSERTSGRFITEDETMLKQLKSQLAEEHIRDFFEKMRQLGFQTEETLALIQETVKEEP